MATAVLPTLQYVTDRKLGKIAKQREGFEKRKSEIVSAAKARDSPEEQLRALLDGCENSYVGPVTKFISPTNLRIFLDQARCDASLSSTTIERWVSEFEQELNVQSTKYEYAALFGKLVTEAIDASDTYKTRLGASKSEGAETASHSSADDSSSASFMEVGREEMHEQRKEWERYSFSQHLTDEEAIEKYLKELFESTAKAKKLVKTPIQNLQEAFRQFDEKVKFRFSVPVLNDTIKGVLKSGLFTGAKRAALIDLKGRTTALSEIADVLNTELDSLGSWHWTTSPIPVTMRKQLNGKYRIFMDEEIYEALFLHHVGAQWAVYMKQTFTGFFHSGAWLQAPHQRMSKKDRARRAYFLGSPSRTPDLVARNIRRNMYREGFFVTQLPSSVSEGSREYEQSDDDDRDEPGKPLLEIKQSLLHLATTEMMMNTKLYGQFTILQSDFKWFGPSLPHSTIFAVLKYFGVTGKWITFFREFLQARLVFVQDGANAESHTRVRGVPMSHVLADALSEAVLFCLDFAVNKRTGGSILYRFHDDLWFWGQQTACTRAWSAMKEFAEVMGLELNDEKTGAATISEPGTRDTDKDHGSPQTELPEGTIRWGFLLLDANLGRWVIDQAQVDEHIKELKRQLDSFDSILGWVHAWNSYVANFFTANFGQPANCMGRQHVQMVIETFQKIQRNLFASMNPATTNAPDFLRKRIKHRFGLTGVPDGFFYLPVELGGLGLRNPFIPLLAIKASSFRSSGERIDRAFEEDENDYDQAKTMFENGQHGPLPNDARSPFVAIDEAFMSREEFTRFREQTSLRLGEAYVNLLESPPQLSVEESPAVAHAYETSVLEIDETLNRKDFTRSWSALSPYWKWMTNMLAQDMIAKFGGFRITFKSLLPVGIVTVLQNEKVSWKG